MVSSSKLVASVCKLACYCYGHKSIDPFYISWWVCRKERYEEEHSKRLQAEHQALGSGEELPIAKKQVAGLQLL